MSGANSETDFHLLDSRVPGRFGGTGETFDWELVRTHRGQPPVILSGGLTPGNVAEAIEITRPFAVDVATGVESSPGVKDHAKLDAFADAVAGVHALRRPVGACRPALEVSTWPSIVTDPCMATIEHRFGPYGGQYVPETLMPALAELEQAWLAGRATIPVISRRSSSTDC